MGVKDSNYQIVYRGEILPRYVPGGWVLFQRPKECGRHFWLGRTEDNFFAFELDRPLSLGDALEWFIAYEAAERRRNAVADINPNYSHF